MSVRPVIGVTGPDRGGRAAWWFTRWALRRAGARAVWLRPKRARRPPLDGLVIGGGADVAPERYGADAMPPPRESPETLANRALALGIFVARRLLAAPRSPSPDPARDELELGLIADADRDGRPVLGICRGAQLLNVHGGGSLWRDLSEFYTEQPNPRTVFPRKRVRVAPDSALASWLDTTHCTVNSLHSQAVRELGDELRVVARDDSGVVQAIERPSHGFWVGVQWHPEYLPQLRSQQRLFRALVTAARGRHERQPGPLYDDAG